MNHRIEWVIVMKKGLLFCLIFFLSCQNIKADSYVVYSNDNGQVIEEKNMDEIQSVASISKIMTALVAIENSEMNEIITVSQQGSVQEGSSIYLKQGEQITMISLLYGLMLRSGNDAAYEIAINVGGSEEGFVKMMNEKAQELGMKHSTFRNPSGLDEEDGGNLSTCYDMALCMSAAMKYPVFRQIVGSQYYSHEKGGKWKNKNKLLFEYAFANGGKTGYTIHAGKTLVSSANNGFGESIVVSFKNDQYFDFHKQKHTEYFNDYEAFLVLDTGNYKSKNYEFEVNEPLKFMRSKSDTGPIKVKTRIVDDFIEFTISTEKTSQKALYALENQPSLLKRIFS